MEAYFVNSKPKHRFKLDLSFFKKASSLFYYAVLLFLIGFAFYFLMLIENNFILSYGGDYTAQYIPMGYHIWDYYHSIFTTGHITLFDETIFNYIADGYTASLPSSSSNSLQSGKSTTRHYGCAVRLVRDVN